MFWRLHAQRLLVERGKKDVGAGPARPGRETRRRRHRPEHGGDPCPLDLARSGRARWLDAQRLAAVAAALEHRSAGVRRNAVKVLPRTQKSVSLLVKHEGINVTCALLDDPDAQVRLATALALADLPPRRKSAAWSPEPCETQRTFRITGFPTH